MKNIALFITTDKPEAVSWAEYAAKKLLEVDAACITTPELIHLFSEEIQEKIVQHPLSDFEKYVDILMTFGGDGTMLGAARNMIGSEIPIMGVNVGKLGFLAEFSVENLGRAIYDLMEGNYRVVDRSLMETVIEGETIYALNDIVIEKKDSPHMITISAYANKNYIGDYRADGLILTTPTGSTAYSLSCGGPIIAPSTQVICLTPISPHSLTLRPLVIDDSIQITLKVHSPTGEANLVADGQVARVLKNNESISFNKSESKIKLIKPLDNSYFDLLRNKLLWAASATKPDANDNNKE